jgi:hypothetical protein
VPLNPQEIQPPANPFTTCECPGHGRSAPSRISVSKPPRGKPTPASNMRRDHQPRAGVGITDPVRTPGRKPSTGTALSRAGG